MSGAPAIDTRSQNNFIKQKSKKQKATHTNKMEPTNPNANTFKKLHMSK